MIRFTIAASKVFRRASQPLYEFKRELECLSRDDREDLAQHLADLLNDTVQLGEPPHRIVFVPGTKRRKEG